MIYKIDLESYETKALIGYITMVLDLDIRRTRVNAYLISALFKLLDTIK